MSIINYDGPTAVSGVIFTYDVFFNLTNGINGRAYVMAYNLNELVNLIKKELISQNIDVNDNDIYNVKYVETTLNPQVLLIGFTEPTN